MAIRLKDGIPIDPNIWQELLEAGESVGKDSDILNSDPRLLS
ncbi:MAG: hypothetical protein QNK24_13505 [Desulfuromusa sp.]|nr:hypothetical protein [Desulfuromusa sp.]